ncbi:PREDICTED: putative E3 ubiquitin-protein ligase XBAT34 [Camelina sativa]|uniref:E3 ubiquitin-protein ligase XBAT34 n=1 Tax=Camelina sativa TaxID=90675 RepID=A0ABM0V178_CAMSA|nr:PREDICTED: putative E3 ubiquitin-protein ligase XBAT34 [Camelina sativa]
MVQQQSESKDELLFQQVSYNDVEAIKLLRREGAGFEDVAYIVPIPEEDSTGTTSMVEDTTGNMAFAVQTRLRNLCLIREDRDKMLCASCGRTGHLAENCSYVRSRGQAQDKTKG